MSVGDLRLGTGQCCCGTSSMPASWTSLSTAFRKARRLRTADLGRSCSAASRRSFLAGRLTSTTPKHRAHQDFPVRVRCRRFRGVPRTGDSRREPRPTAAPSVLRSRHSRSGTPWHHAASGRRLTLAPTNPFERFTEMSRFDGTHRGPGGSSVPYGPTPRQERGCCQQA
jgi:hypothetical protein